MGDRCSIDVYFPSWAENIPEIQDHLDNYRHGDFDWQHVDDGCVIWVSEHECNYAESEMADLLRTNKVPFDKHWTSGAEYGPGVENVRFDGDKILSAKVDHEYVGGWTVNLLKDLDDLGDAEVRKRLNDLKRECGLDFKITKLQDIPAPGGLS